MTNMGGLLIAAGFAAAIIVVGLSIADHIKHADVIEYRTPYYALRSQHNRYLPP